MIEKGEIKGTLKAPHLGGWGVKGKRRAIGYSVGGRKQEVEKSYKVVN